jgi:hypothetical protein
MTSPVLLARYKQDVQKDQKSGATQFAHAVGTLHDAATARETSCPAWQVAPASQRAGIFVVTTRKDSI